MRKALVHLPKLFLFPNDTCIRKIRCKKVKLWVTLTALLTWTMFFFWSGGGVGVPLQANSSALFYFISWTRVFSRAISPNLAVLLDAISFPKSFNIYRLRIHANFFLLLCIKQLSSNEKCYLMKTT